MSGAASTGALARSLDQRRAADALACVKRLIAGENSEFLGAYRSYVERLAAAIIMNGLGQALATERAAAGMGEGGGHRKADERAHQRLYEHLNQWLCRPDGGVYPGAEDVLEAMMAGSQTAYIRAQAEALAWLEWHRKFCQAHLPRREED